MWHTCRTDGRLVSAEDLGCEAHLNPVNTREEAGSWSVDTRFDFARCWDGDFRCEWSTSIAWGEA